jgi:hypothetical protein
MHFNHNMKKFRMKICFAPGRLSPSGVAIRLALPNEVLSGVGEGWCISLKAVLTPLAGAADTLGSRQRSCSQGWRFPGRTVSRRL